MPGPVVVALVCGVFANMFAVAALLLLVFDRSWWLVAALLAATAISSGGAWRAITTTGAPQSEAPTRKPSSHGHGGDVTGNVETYHTSTTDESKSATTAPSTDGAEVPDTDVHDG